MFVVALHHGGNARNPDKSRVHFTPREKVLRRFNPDGVTRRAKKIVIDPWQCFLPDGIGWRDFGDRIGDRAGTLWPMADIDVAFSLG